MLDFARFLQDRSLADHATATQIRKRSDTERAPLGQILVMRGDLSVAQVMSLLEMQVDEPHRRIGELAVANGFITTVQLEQALVEQRDSRRHQILLAREEKLLSESDLVETIVAYVQLLELAQAK